MSDRTEFCEKCEMERFVDVLDDGWVQCQKCLAMFQPPPAVASPAERGGVMSAEEVTRYQGMNFLDKLAAEMVVNRLCYSHEALRARLASLESELREAKADRERIEFLREHGHGEGVVRGIFTAFSLTTVRSGKHMPEDMPTLREMIDAARSGSSPERGTTNA
jgi:hypothetical protein